MNRIIILALLAIFLTVPATAADVSREQMKGLDEQIQEIKSDVLGIATELDQLEEKLLYPSNTQVSVFVSLAEGEAFRLDSLEVEIDGKPVARHLYSFQELEALRKGGVQRIHTGNIRTGAHAMEVTLLGTSEAGADIRKTQSFTIEKGIGPEIVEIILTRNEISLKEG